MTSEAQNNVDQHPFLEIWQSSVGEKVSLRAGWVTGVTPFHNSAGFPTFSYGLETKTKNFQMEGCGIVLKHLFLRQRDQVFNQAFRSDITRDLIPGYRKLPVRQHQPLCEMFWRPRSSILQLKYISSNMF